METMIADTPAWVVLKTILKDKDELKTVELLATVKQWKFICDDLEERLSKKLDIPLVRMNKIIKKLFKIGVIARFTVAELVKGEKPGLNAKTSLNSYWLFNPYLSYYNQPDFGEETLFDGTFYAKVMK